MAVHDALSVCWYCTDCGPRSRKTVDLYQSGMLNAHSRRLDPHCATCGMPLRFGLGEINEESHVDPKRGMVLVINGTCSSGKTTISCLLSENYDYIQVDGDWILQRARQENPEVQSDDLHEELATLAADLSLLGMNVALAHIIPPEHLGTYERVFNSREMRYRIVILMPDVPVLLNRNETRKCWPKTTPEYWVMKFHDEFLGAASYIQHLFHDNTNETPIETAGLLAGQLSAE